MDQCAIGRWIEGWQWAGDVAELANSEICGDNKITSHRQQVAIARRIISGTIPQTAHSCWFPSWTKIHPGSRRCGIWNSMRSLPAQPTKSLPSLQPWAPSVPSVPPFDRRCCCKKCFSWPRETGRESLPPQAQMRILFLSWKRPTPRF